VTELHSEVSFRALIYLVKIPVSNRSLMKSDPPLYISLSALMALATEENLVEGQWRSFVYVKGSEDYEILIPHKKVDSLIIVLITVIIIIIMLSFFFLL
jgi:hypothetical protein